MRKKFVEISFSTNIFQIHTILISLIIFTNLFALDSYKVGLTKPMIRDLRHIYARYDIPITNDGRFGWDPESQVPGGGRWLRGTDEGYIFGAGVWVGAKINGTKQVSVGYNPDNIKTEMVPGNLPNEPGYTNLEEIVFISTDYPNNALPPWPMGYESDGNPITISEMDSWSQFNDLDPSQQFEAGAPIGVLITAETYSWNTSFRDMWDIAFIRYNIKNINPDQQTWTDAYVGFAMDPDIGDPTNDLGGAFPDLNIGFAYSSAQLSGLELGLEHPPGYVGIKFLDGPYKDPITNEAKMTTFAIWGNDFQPNTDELRYNLLARGTYDTLDIDPADKRIFVSSGPFNLAYGDSVTFVVGICFAWPAWYYDPSLQGDPEHYADYLKIVAENAQYVYDNEFRFPKPPTLPRLSLYPQNQKMVITWDDKAEYSVERLLALPEISDSLDFEGYHLWRSTTGQEGGYELLGAWDKVSFDDLSLPIGKNTGLVHSFVDNDLTNGKLYYYAITAYDKGEYLPQHYGDPEYELVPPLETGMVYGTNLNTETPNVPPSNFTPPEMQNLELVQGNVEEIEFTIEANYLIPDSILNKIFQIRFSNTPGFRYDKEVTTLGPDIYVVDQSNDDTVSATLNFPVKFPASLVESDIFNGMTLNYTGPDILTNKIDTAYFDPPQNNVVIYPQVEYDNKYLSPQTSVPTIAPFGGYFFPHKYLIEFYEASGRKRIYLYDLNNGDTLDYEIRTFGRNYSLASFDKVIQSIDPQTGDTIWVWFNNPADFRNSLTLEATGYKIYIPGVYIFIEDPDREVQSGDKLYIELSGYAVPHENDIFQFTTKASTINFNANLSQVKVVPNPYLVRAAWDIDQDYQKIQFINLPTECTIRIYTIAGDPVKVINHTTPYKTGFDAETKGTAYWNLMTENNQKIATGVYVFYIDSPYGNTVGRFAVIR